MHFGLPHPSFNRRKAKDFVEDLAKARKGLKEEQQLEETVNGDKSMSSRQIL
jgi:hypothetical protein